MLARQHRFTKQCDGCTIVHTQLGVTLLDEQFRRISKCFLQQQQQHDVACCSCIQMKQDKKCLLGTSSTCRELLVESVARLCSMKLLDALLFNGISCSNTCTCGWSQCCTAAGWDQNCLWKWFCSLQFLHVWPNVGQSLLPLPCHWSRWSYDEVCFAKLCLLCELELEVGDWTPIFIPGVFFLALCKSMNWLFRWLQTFQLTLRRFCCLTKLRRFQKQKASSSEKMCLHMSIAHTKNETHTYERLRQISKLACQGQRSQLHYILVHALSRFLHARKKALSVWMLHSSKADSTPRTLQGLAWSYRHLSPKVKVLYTPTASGPISVRSVKCGNTNFATFLQNDRGNLAATPRLFALFPHVILISTV